MTELFDQAFQKILSFWPEYLDVSEKGDFGRGGGVSIANLNFVHTGIREQIWAMEDNEILFHMDWAIFTVLHGMAKTQSIVHPHAIDVESVRQIFDRNINKNATG